MQKRHTFQNDRMGVVLLAVKIANSIKGCGIGHTAS